MPNKNNKNITKNVSDFNGLKIKNILSFYIDNINEKFFINLQNHPNRYFVNKVLPKIQKNLDEDELQKFIQLDNLTKNNKIKLMLNLVLKKIASKTGMDNNELFNSFGIDNFGESLFINELEEPNETRVLAENISERKYEYIIDINKNCYLHKYISEIQLSFFLENEHKMLSGGFSLNKTFAKPNGLNYIDVISKIYFHSLIKHFITKQLYPISLNNMLDIIEGSQENKNRKVQKNKSQTIDFKEITIDNLHENWINLVNRKYLNFLNVSDKEKTFYENTLFYSILIVNIIMLSLYEELKIYFTNERPELILNLLDKPPLINANSNQDSKTDFLELTKFLQQNYVDKTKNLKLNKIKKYQDLLETLNEQKSYEQNSFGKPISTVELYSKENKPFISEQDILTKNVQLRMIYFAVIFPELFGIDESTGYFIKHKQFIEILTKTQLQKFKMSESLSDKIDKSLCELNYDYITFIGSEPSMFIIKNNTSAMNDELFLPHKFSGLYENYFWSQIYVQARMWKRMHVEAEYNYDIQNNIESNHKKRVEELETLILSWYDNYYGMPEIKNIINKINELSDLKKSIEMLIIEIRQKDELLKKDRERKNILFAYIVASLIGFINFFGMVYTILTVDKPYEGLTLPNIITISIGGVLITILLSILFYFGTKMIKSKSKKR